MNNENLNNAKMEQEDNHNVRQNYRKEETQNVERNWKSATSANEKHDIGRSEKLSRILDTDPSPLVSRGIGVIVAISLFLVLLALLLPVSALDDQTLWHWITSR